MGRVLTGALVSMAFALKLGAGDSLKPEELKLFQDSGGWEYVSMSDGRNGIQTNHVCFDGRPHPNECSGTLTFTPAHTFVEKLHLQGQSYDRHGTYQVNDGKVALFDELGTQDGPYAVDINTQTKHMVLEMPQVRMELELESQYRDELKAQKQHPQ